jgi:hypothetical protein
MIRGDETRDIDEHALGRGLPGEWMDRRHFD